MKKNDQNETTFKVAVNHEEQYSIWPSDKDIPEGWRFVNFESTKEDCLNHISKIWTDMRPLSLRKKMTS